MSRRPLASDIIGKTVQAILSTPSETGDGTPVNQSSRREFFRIALQFEDSTMMAIGMNWEIDPPMIVEAHEFLGYPDYEFTSVFKGSVVVNVFYEPASGEMFVLCDNGVIGTLTLEDYGTLFSFTNVREFEKYFGFSFTDLVPFKFE